MKRIDLVKIEHNVQIGDICGHIEPNVTEDSIFYDNGEPIGFYIKKISRRLWDYPPEHDIALLKKLQTSKYTTTDTQTNPDREMTNARNQHKDDKKRLAMFSLQKSVRNQATNWGVTKATGRGARVGRA